MSRVRSKKNSSRDKDPSKIGQVDRLNETQDFQRNYTSKQSTSFSRSRHNNGNITECLHWISACNVKQ